MHLTDTEAAVVRELGRKRVATMRLLCEQFHVSHMTVVRALNKLGYYSSYNLNAAYYTLRNTPQFDEHGLWSYRTVRFSRFGSLPETIVQLVNNASDGMTVDELQERLGTKVANLVSRLCRQQRIAQIRQGRRAVYLATDRSSQQRQIERRQTREEPSPSQPTPEGETAGMQLPPRCDATLVLSVLVQAIRTPQADAGELAKSLRQQGVRVTKTQVQRIFGFYRLQKKRNPGRG